MNGNDMYELAKRLYPINRSLTGNGVRDSLKIIKDYLPDLKVYEVPSGTRAFDWTVPPEWVINEAYIEDEGGKRIVDYSECNLHVIGYSFPMDMYVTRDELPQYIMVEETRPDSIPYVTSYYAKKSGFCMSRNQLNALPDGKYHLYIDSELIKGSMTYADLIIPANCDDENTREVYFATYLCHPSMANDNLSGLCMAVALAQEIKNIPTRRFTYRFLFAPETIGAIYYLSKNLDIMKRNIRAGYVLTCVGDDRTFSYIPTCDGDTLADRAALNILKSFYPKFDKYTFLDRASDERQYCSPGVDLPICVVCRSKYGLYPEYHTSDDDLSLISENGLATTKVFYMELIEALEYNKYYRIKCLCEPQLGKRGLYPSIGKKNTYDDIIPMIDFIAYANGKRDLIEISNLINQPIKKLIPIIDRLIEENLLEYEE